MQDELANAISNVRSFIRKLPKTLDLGSVVKHSNGNIGIVFGIEAPEEADQPWSYCLRWVQIEGTIATECDGLINAWVDADDIEEIPPQPSRQLPCLQWPQIGGVGGEIVLESYDFKNSCQSWVDADEPDE